MGTVLLNKVSQLVKCWREDNIATFSAALAYYTVFALTPFIVICITIVGLILGQETATNQVLNHIASIMGDDSAHQLQTMIQQSCTLTTGLTTKIISFLILLFGASGIFAQIQLGLNHIWRIKPSRNQGVLILIKNRFLSFFLVIAVALLLLVSLITSIVLTAINTRIMIVLPVNLSIILTLNFTLSLVIITLLFALIFKLLPAVSLSLWQVIPGAFISALFFSLGKYLLSEYLGRMHVAYAFGPASALIVILVWIYYSAQILFLGAEITKIQTKMQQRLEK